MQIIRLTNETKNDLLESLLKRSPNQYSEYEAKVIDILEDVKKNGDEAVFRLTKTFDKADINKSTV